ncbi:hypothetical protein HII31_12321 [Pseudocercospora fuligena]|uniref:Rhodopsin domain-containing protein n=1 Tax=Pseudocercospora fuligena TaxID=685502 RepID=A0A8H6RA22_9PEZI|nr:hypothetical protein HII31_12321 [Pseudocercospora fuligena]
MYDHNGFATTTETDHRPWVWVASFLAMIYSLLCLAARFTGKWDLLWWDDVVLSSGYLAAIVHWGLLFRSLIDGTGLSSLVLSSSELGNAASLYFGSRIPFFLALCLAKLSMLIFTRRIFAGDIYRENIFFGVSYGFVILYGLLAILLSSAGCHPTETLAPSTDAVCNANTARWAVITLFDGLTELIILAMPIWFISKNQLKASKKRIVIFVYSFRLIVIAFSIATTASYFNFLKDGRNSIDISPVIAWQEVLLAFSLISASFPCLRSFLWAFMSRGLMTMYGNTTASASDPRSHMGSMQLRSMNKSHVSRNESEAGLTTGEGRLRLRPERSEYHVDIRGDSARGQKRSTTDLNPAKRSDDSDRMIISMETSYRVESS